MEEEKIQTETKLLIALMCVVGLAIALYFIYYQINPKPCPEEEIPLKLIEMKTGKNNITFTYLWEKENPKNLTIFAIHFKFFEKYETEPERINEFALYKDDTLKVTHDSDNTITFDNWYGQNYLYLINKENGCEYIHQGGINEYQT